MTIKKFQLVRKEESIKPVTGVKVHFSLEDARQLLALTSYSEIALNARVKRFGSSDTERIHDHGKCEMTTAMEDVRIESRNFLRTLAKKILNIDNIEPTTMAEFSERMFD